MMPSVRLLADTRSAEWRTLPEPGEIVFEVTEAVEGGYDARALDYSIFTQGEDLEDLKSMVKDTVRCHFDDRVAREIRLRLAKDEVITV